MSPFHQPEGDYCGTCPHKVTKWEPPVKSKHGITQKWHHSCKSFGCNLLTSNARPLRVDECKAEDA